MSRIEEIIYDLIKIDNYVTTKDLSKIFGVSDRTIRSDLDKVEKVLPYYGLSLDRKSGVGIKLVGNKEARDTFVIDNVQITVDQLDIYSPTGRILFILVELLLQKNIIHIEYLTSLLFVSRSTVQKDLVVIEQWLNKRDLKLVRQENGGMLISGKESKIRETISDIIMQKDRKLEILKEEQVDQSVNDQLNKLLDFDVKIIKEIVKETEKEFQIKFTYDSLNNLVTHISIAIMRIKHDKVIQLPEDLVTQVSGSKEFQISDHISKLIKKGMKIEIPISEVQYLALHVIGASFEDELIHRLGLEYKGIDVKELANKITVEFLEIIEKILLIDLSDNERLVEGLTLHLITTINRIEYDLKLYNPILDDIKENYSSIFILCWNINLLFDKYLGKTVSEDEIAYIALHVAAAIESTKEKNRVAVVCTTGIGASRLLKVRLEKHFPQFDIINYSDREIEDLDNIDFILSTIPLETKKPYLVVNSILDDREIERINMFLNVYKQKSPEELFSIDDLHVIEGVVSKDEILQILTKRSVEEQYVKDTFLSSVYDREQINSTEVGDGVVLTHGFPDHVNQSKIVIAVLKNSIIWNEEEVNIVILQIMSKQDIKNKTYQLDWFYRCLGNTDFLDKLSKVESAEEMLSLLRVEGMRI